MKDYLKLATHYQTLIGGLFAQRTGRANAGWWADFIYAGGDKFLSATECLNLGLVDEIIDDDYGPSPRPTTTPPAPSATPVDARTE
jgi:ATP-dependent protease ClpP protease subunit